MTYVWPVQRPDNYALVMRARVLDAVAEAEKLRGPVLAKDLGAFAHLGNRRRAWLVRAVSKLPPDELGRRLAWVGRLSAGHAYTVLHV
jgi:hypothetical protein